MGDRKIGENIPKPNSNSRLGFITRTEKGRRAWFPKGMVLADPCSRPSEPMPRRGCQGLFPLLDSVHDPTVPVVACTFIMYESR